MSISVNTHQLVLGKWWPSVDPDIFELLKTGILQSTSRFSAV